MVLTILGGSTKLGIDAPRRLRVIRPELFAVATRFLDCTSSLTCASPT
jgi:sRNA-binding carbon storage regulator CsrA